MSDRIWITWETQRRNRTLSKLVDAKLYEFDLDLPAWRRYPVATWKTLSCLVSEKPRIIFAQNPSIVLAFLTILYANVLGKKIIIDAHNAGLFPAEGRHKWLNWIAARLFRWATITIVSNDRLKSYVEKQGGASVSIPDPVPVIDAPAERAALKGAFNILFICSWAEDEPYAEVLRAATQLDNSICIYITGNSKDKLKSAGIPLAENVVLTGYVVEDEFNGLLHGCDAVMVLTTRDECLLCGAYEGVSAGKPLLLSDTQVLRDYFSQGAVYVDNTATDIIHAISTIQAEYPRLKDDIHTLRSLRDTEMVERLNSFENHLQASNRTPA